MDVILGIRKSLVGINQKNMGRRGHLILESLVLPQSALLVLQRKVLLCHARGTSFLLPKTEVSINEFFEPNETVIPHNIPYSLSDLMGKHLCE
jgi:hypothetical protein